MSRPWPIIILCLGIILGLFLREFLPQRPAAAKLVTIQSRNLQYQIATRATTVGELLAEENFPDSVILEGPSPDRISGDSIPYRPSGSRVQNDTVIHGMTIEVHRPVSIVLTDGGNKQAVVSQAVTVGDFILENRIALAPTDRVAPALESYLAEGLKINIDRIVDLEITEVNDIPYESHLVYDPAANYGQERVIVAGRPGKKQQQFLITYKNGVEIKRKLLREKVLQPAAGETRAFGTKIEIEEVREGRASWYAYKRCMCAAHPFYDKGRYVRVTSLASGKSIIVKINDRGPDLSVHPDRVIDLDSTAFKELSPLGAGTLGVRVELLR